MEDFNYEKQVRGKGKEREGAQNFISYDVGLHRQLGKEKLPGEYEKTSEEIGAIDAINEMIAREFEELKLEKPAPVGEDQVHLLSGEDFEKAGGDKSAESGFHRAKQRQIAINADLTRQEGRLHRYKVMLHEAIHASSAEIYHISHDENENIEKQFSYLRRSGYLSWADEKMPKTVHFRGFNEAITEKTVIELLQRNAESLTSRFNITEKEQQGPARFSYSGYRAVVNTIIHRIATRKKESAEGVWTRFKKGMFTGEMMHLNDVEDAFGKGSLRIVAALGSSTFKESVEKEESEAALKYFQANSEEERDEIARDILNGHDYEMYKKRRKGA